MLCILGMCNGLDLQTASITIVLTCGPLVLLARPVTLLLLLLLAVHAAEGGSVDCCNQHVSPVYNECGLVWNSDTESYAFGETAAEPRKQIDRVSRWAAVASYLITGMK